MEMGRKYFFCVCALVLSTPLFSQDTSFIKKIKVPSFIDTLFIDRDLNNYSVRVFTNYKNSRFKFSSADEEILYEPGNPAGIGFGVGSRKLILDIAFNINPKDKEPTDRFDFQGTLMLNHHSIDFFLQSYHGYYLDYEDQEEFRGDISSFSTGINYLYLINSEKFSLTAMKSGLSRQKKAAASLGLGGFLYINQISADSTIVPPELVPEYDEEARLEKLLGIGAGLLVSLDAGIPIWKNFFAAVSFTPGIGLMYKSAVTESGSSHPGDPFIFQSNLSGIVGFNAKKLYINFNLGHIIYKTSLDFDYQIIYNTAHAKLALGYKFGKR